MGEVVPPIPDLDAIRARAEHDVSIFDDVPALCAEVEALRAEIERQSEAWQAVFKVELRRRTAAEAELVVVRQALTDLVMANESDYEQAERAARAVLSGESRG